MIRQIICMNLLFAVAAFANADVVDVESINELAVYAARDGNNIKMKSGTYQMTDYLTEDIIAKRHSAAMQQARQEGRRRGDAYMFSFSGGNNTFDFTGVTIEVDTKLLSAFRNCYIREFLISGSGNTFIGLTITDIGDKPTYMGGNNVSIYGDDNTFKDITVNVRGSSPYGYGDFLGKGSESIVSTRKHSGVQICGTNTTLIGCKVLMRSYGHAFYIQGGVNTVFKDCYAKGEMRSTDDMLSETSGIAFEKGFESVYTNRDGEKKIPHGYMKSLAECGFRTYAQGGADNRLTGKVTLINCVAENVRVGFALHANEQTEHIHIENCEAIGCERGYYLNKAKVEQSLSDAIYGPMMYLVGNEASDIELTLTNPDSNYKVHALATICGNGHNVIFKQDETLKSQRQLPIMLGYGMPSAGENSSPIPEASAQSIKLINNTSMPIEIGEKASDVNIITNAEIARNQGQQIHIEKSK